MADPSGREGHYKDEVLDRLAATANVAQFVSFGPDLRQRFAWVQGFPPNTRFDSLAAAVAAILGAAPEGAVNVRSYHPQSAKSRDFLYGLRTGAEVVAALQRLAAAGLFTVVNETIDVADGGVSGVAFGAVLEVAPGDTPRCVEKPGTAALPRAMGLRLLQTVYGVAPELPADPELRVEFSLHPLRRGYRRGHTVLWETERFASAPAEAPLQWPNRWSRLMGDKAFGLLVADAAGLPVPRTLVVPRGLAPFSFGAPTGLAETWIRTCPVVQQPGKFTTRHGWMDPFRLLQQEDPEGTEIASVLAQQGVDARYSGALIAQANGEPLIEGVAGEGDEFMLGRRAPEALPAALDGSLRELYGRAAAALGPVRFEWVADAGTVWVVQLHNGASPTAGRVLYPGTAARFHPFRVEEGIDALRELVSRVEGTGDGITVIGRVGVTSHLGDVLRRARVPSRLEDTPAGAPAGAAHPS
ncbi:MAG TPA: hypothetical protein VKY89_24185 [Thermoanaerobaculia bacterium]|nr:hypothetical protein [Thermoanaerobaculia bacterium]